MNRLLIGNIISLVGSFFLCASCVAKTKRRVVACQLFQCIILTVAQIVFGKGSGAVSMSMAGVRNLIIASGHYNIFVMLLIALITFAFGLYFNTAGFIGLIPIFCRRFLHRSPLFYQKRADIEASPRRAFACMDSLFRPDLRYLRLSLQLRRRGAERNDSCENVQGNKGVK